MKVPAEPLINLDIGKDIDNKMYSVNGSENLTIVIPHIHGERYQLFILVIVNGNLKKLGKKIYTKRNVIGTNEIIKHFILSQCWW